MEKIEWVWAWNIVLLVCITALTLGIIQYHMLLVQVEYDYKAREMGYDKIYEYMDNIKRGDVNETEQVLQVPQSSF